MDDNKKEFEPNEAALDRLLERVEQAERGLQATLLVVHDFVISDEFKQKVAPLFCDLGAEITFLADLAEHKDTVLPHLAEDLQALFGEEKISLKQFFEDDSENGITPYEAILRKRSGEAAAEDDTSASVLKELAVMRGIAPKGYTMPNNKLSNTLKDLLKYGEPVNLLVGKVGRGSRQKEITSYALAEFVPGDGVKISSGYTPTDRTFNNAVSSLWEQDNDAPFTAAHIWKSIPGNRGKSPSPKQIADIEKSLEKQRFLMIEVDATEELMQRGIIDEHGRDSQGRTVRARFREPALMLKEVSFEVTNQHGKHEMKAYRLVSQPILYHYAQLTNQCITAPVEHLDIKEIDSKGAVTESQISNTPDRVALREYYYRRIAVMKNDLTKAKANKRQHDMRRKKDPSLPDKPVSAFCKQTHRILFDSAFEETEVDKKDGKPVRRDRLQQHREYVFQCLDYWKAIEYIKGYKTITSGRGGKVEAVDIILP